MDSNFKDHAPILYDKFWWGIGFDADLTVGLDYIGQLFLSSDQQIYNRYPILNQARYLEQWEPGKTDWEEQRVIASNMIISELERRRLILTADQVMDSASLLEAAQHATANIIYTGLGVERFKTEIEKSQADYALAMNKDKWNIDVNADASLDEGERRNSVTFSSR